MKKRENLLLWSLIIITMLLIYGCGDNNSMPNMTFQYPLTIGSSWHYDNFITLNFDSLATYNGLSDTTYYSSGTVEIIESTVIFDTLDVFNFATTITEDSNVFESNQYYNDSDHFLFCYGYTGGSMISPKTNNFTYIIFDGKKFHDVKEIFNYIEHGIITNEYARDDSINYDPVKVLDYPLEENKQWIYRTSNNPWRINKTIIGKESIDVPAGSFNCWKIQWTFPESDWKDDIEFYDFMSKAGLVKRVIDFKNSECYDENGNFIGYLDSKEEKLLTDYLKNK